MKKHLLTILFLVFITYLAAPRILSIIQGPAPTPNIFVDNYTIEQASLQSETTGKPLLVLVTADWCPPCQSLKKGALTDPMVTQWVSENLVPVYLEDSANPDQIQLLPLNSFPTTFIIKDGQILGQFSGNQSATKFLTKIKAITNES